MQIDLHDGIRRSDRYEYRHVLDSSCWLEFFAATERADLFAPAIDAVEQLVVPVSTVYEVVKKLAREVGEESAASALAVMQRGQVVALDMADSILYATARSVGAVLWTQDAHFEGLPGVNFFRKP